MPSKSCQSARLLGAWQLAAGGDSFRPLRDRHRTLEAHSNSRRMAYGLSGIMGHYLITGLYALADLTRYPPSSLPELVPAVAT